MRKVVFTILIAAAMWAPVYAMAEDKMAAALAVANSVTEAAPIPKKEAPTELGVLASELLPGNGTRAGYVLGHGSIIPESEWVYVGARRAQRNKDYTIDYASGSLFFTEPVRKMDSVRVDYRYSEKSKGERNVSAPGMLPFRFGGGLQMNMVYSYRAADPDKGAGIPDILTYGASSTSKLGGSSTLSSMMYMSSPQQSNRLSLTGGPVTNPKVANTKKGRLMVQNADLGLGKVKLKLGLQDVGENFNGFQSLRESKVAADDVLNKLEKEKGIKRMSIAGEMPSLGSGALNFSFDKISDKNDDITSQSFGYDGSNLKLSFSTRSVGKSFSMFKNLQQADAGQFAAEAGMRRTNYGLQFRTGMAAENKPVWSALSFTQLTGDTGSLSYRSVDLDFGRVKVQADVRSVDPTFNRMAALNDEERTRMALMARRQFNPFAKPEEVTAKDKAQINQETGLNRTNYLVQVDNSWLTLANVETENADLSSRTIHFGGKWFSLDFSHRSIDPGFNRLSSLQPVESAQYGNEYGMTRSQIGGKLSVAGGEALFNHANVTDHQGAGVARRSLSFTSPRLKFNANFQDIDPEFSRIMDLSDSDRKLMVQERGFKRSDYSLNFQATKYLNIDTYFYNSTNVTEGQTRDQSRQKITYSPGGGRDISFFRDNYSYISESGNLSSYSRQKITYDNSINLLGGLKFQSLSDVNTVQEGSEMPTTTTISQYRVTSSDKAPTSFALDMLSKDFGDGRFENTHSVGIRSKAISNLSLLASYAITDRENNNSETSAGVGVEWPISKNLAMSLKVDNRDGGPKGSQQSHQFAIKGLLARRFLLLDNIKIDSGSNTTALTGRQIGCDNGLKLEAGFLGGSIVMDNSDKLNPKNGIYYTSRVLRYESDKDPKKWYHLTFFRQNLVTPDGNPATKRNFALDMRFSPRTSVTLSSYFGKDEQKGAVLNVGGTVFKLSHSLGKGLSLVTDYKRDVNEQTGRRARVAGLGISGTFSDKASWELYVGRAHIMEGLQGENKTVFRMKYDHKIDADHFITFTAEKKPGVEKNSINPYEGDTTARLDFRTLFH